MRTFPRAASRFLFSLAALLAATASTAAAEPCSVKIGLLFPETGPAALIGERSRQAAELALETLRPELRSRISLIVEDTQMKPAVGLSATRKLIDESGVIALTGFGSELVGAIGPLVEAKEIAGVFVTPDRRPIVGKKFLFRHWLDATDMFPLVSAEMNKEKLKSIALVYSEIPAMTLFGEHFAAAANGAGLDVVIQKNVLPTDLEFRSIVTAIAAKKPDAIAFFFLPPQPSAFMKALRATLPNTPVFTYINVENSHEVKAAGGAMNGIRYAGPRFEPKFIEAFKKRFSESPEFASGNIFDIVTMYAAAVDAGACTGTDIRDYVAKQTKLTGALGEYGVQDGNDFRFPVHLKAIENGAFVDLQ